MEPNIYDFRDYKSYLNELCDHRPRGFRKLLAESAGCQNAYMTHVLRGTAHLSWEQAEAISRSIAQSPNETEYFLFMIEFTRAGTRELRALLSRKLDSMRESHLSIKKRVEVKATLGAAEQAFYYSSWYYSAIHVLLTIPGLQTKEALSQRLSLHLNVVANALEFLVANGLAVKRGSKFVDGAVKIHLENESPLRAKSHANWRLQAIRALENSKPHDLHFSSVATLSEADFEKIRSRLVNEIESCVKVIKQSPAERACVLTIDFFDV